jgi:hypothetical protein
MTESMTKSQIDMTQSFTEETTISVDQSNNKIEQQPTTGDDITEQPAEVAPEVVNGSADTTNASADQQSPNNNQHTYEVSVTEKENLLMMNSGTFGQQQQQQQPEQQQNLNNILLTTSEPQTFTNGKSSNTAGDSNPFMDDLIQATTELIIEDTVINNGQQNGHKNIDNNVL